MDPYVDLYEHQINLEKDAVVVRRAVCVVRVVCAALAPVNPTNKIYRQIDREI